MKKVLLTIGVPILVVGFVMGIIALSKQVGGFGRCRDHVLKTVLDQVRANKLPAIFSNTVFYTSFEHHRCIAEIVVGDQPTINGGTIKTRYIFDGDADTVLWYNHEVTGDETAKNGLPACYTSQRCLSADQYAEKEKELVVNPKATGSFVLKK